MNAASIIFLCRGARPCVLLEAWNYFGRWPSVSTWTTKVLLVSWRWRAEWIADLLFVQSSCCLTYVHSITTTTRLRGLLWFDLFSLMMSPIFLPEDTKQDSKNNYPSLTIDWTPGDPSGPHYKDSYVLCASISMHTHSHRYPHMTHTDTYMHLVFLILKV